VHERVAHSALSRFVSPSTQPGRTEPPLPGIPPPGSRCALAVPARLDAFLPDRPPRCISTGRALGVLPSELDLAVIAYASRRRIPSCDRLPVPASAPPCGGYGLTRPRCPPLPFRSGSRARFRVSHTRVRRSRLSPRAASLQGFPPRGPSLPTTSRPSSAPYRRTSSLRAFRLFATGPLPVGACLRRVSPSNAALALLGFSLPEAFSIPCLGPAGGAVTPRGVARLRPARPLSVPARAGPRTTASRRTSETCGTVLLSCT
jgi:hypothetical protein